MKADPAHPAHPPPALARTRPSQSVLAINIETYADAASNLAFGVCGLSEEIFHSDQALFGHVRSQRLLERDSRDTLTALLQGQVELATAKETIVHNELACDWLYQQTHPLVEALDQFTVASMATALAESDHGTELSAQLPQDPVASTEATADATGTDLTYGDLSPLRTALAQTSARTEDSLLDSVAAADQRTQTRLASTIIQRTLRDRDTPTTPFYRKLTRLAAQFDNAVVPWIIGRLALHIPPIDLDRSPRARVAAARDIDMTHRFDRLYETLMSDTLDADDIPSWTSSVWDPSAKLYRWPGSQSNRLTSVVHRIAHEAGIETGELPPTPALPLLDAPLTQTPSYARILAHPEVAALCSVSSDTLQDLLFDVFMAFGSIGCVVPCTADWQPIGYLPNYFLLTDHHGSQSYYHRLFDTIATRNLIDQLLHRSLTHTVSELACPFCPAAHDPREADCVWNALLGAAAKGLASPHKWPDYRGATTALLEDFVATSVPGEAALAAARTSRATTG